MEPPAANLQRDGAGRYRFAESLEDGCQRVRKV
jgi:hypothetical protein